MEDRAVVAAEIEKLTEQRLFDSAWVVAREAGIDFFDCANVYPEGDSERILGELVAHERDEIVLASKVYFPFGTGPRSRGYSRAAILHQVEGTLTRLKTDYLDLYQIHWPSREVPREETWRAMERLRDMPLERIHSRKLRSFDETAFL